MHGGQVVGLHVDGAEGLAAGAALEIAPQDLDRDTEHPANGDESPARQQRRGPLVVVVDLDRDAPGVRMLLEQRRNERLRDLFVAALVVDLDALDRERRVRRVPREPAVLDRDVDLHGRSLVARLRHEHEEWLAY